MQIEAKKYIKHPGGFTLVELILVAGTIAVVAGSLIGLIANGYADFELGSDRSTLLQDGRAAIEQMVRILRQAKSFDDASESTDAEGFLTFRNATGVTEQFKFDALTSEIQYGQPGSLSALTGSVSSLIFTCYDINGDVLTGPFYATSIQSVHISVTLTDGQNSFILQDRAFFQTDFQYIVINEIMYYPDYIGNEEKNFEWVELYNLGGSPVDLSGWTIWTDSVINEDTIIADPMYGTGSTTIPPNGYAVITGNQANLYDELIGNGGFEDEVRKNDKYWKRDGWEKIKDEANAHGGKHYLISTDSGSTWVYQEISIPAGIDSCSFVFWEKTNAPTAQTQLTVTIRNVSDQILATVCSGQMHSNWSSHGLDLTPYANQTVRIHFSTNKSTPGDALLLDDVSVGTSYTDSNGVRLIVDDDTIGELLNNIAGSVTITDGTETIDSVTYNSSWGGDGDGTSLERISPHADPNDPGNWEIGPINGTPGSQN
jgi:type II secretory pathway pseudopilin PulG